MFRQLAYDMTQCAGERSSEGRLSKATAKPRASARDVLVAVALLDEPDRLLNPPARKVSFDDLPQRAFDRLKKRALAIIAKHGGSIDRSTLLQNLHTDAGTMKKVITTLFMCEMIESEMLTNGKTMYYIRKAA